MNDTATHTSTERWYIPRAVTVYAWLFGVIGVVVIDHLLSQSIPVIIFERAEFVRQSDNSVTLEVSGLKIRDCPRMLDDPAFVAEVMGPSKRWRDADLQREVKVVGQRGHDYQARWFERVVFGVLTWVASERLRGPINYAMITAVHDCDGERVVTRLGPFNIGDLMAQWRIAQAAAESRGSDKAALYDRSIDPPPYVRTLPDDQRLENSANAP